jgi:hypothetical protein
LKLVEGEGFEPSKSMTSDLQSDPFGRSGIPPKRRRHSQCKPHTCQALPYKNRGVRADI